MDNQNKENLNQLEDEDMQKRAERKKALLDQRKEKRAEDIQRKKVEDIERQVKVDEYDYFTVNFKEECNSLNTKLSSEEINGADKVALASYFQHLTDSYEKLLKFVNDSTMFLRPFQLEQAQKTLGKIQADIAAKRQELMPKKKFAFKSKKKATETAKEIVPVKPATKSYNFNSDGFDITGKIDENIVMSGDDINKRDVSISKMSKCKVELRGYPGTVHFSDIKDCVILCGPVSGSVFVDDCTNSKIGTGCQQLRVHNTTDTDFYLHVTSRAIIEDTKKVRFAPYNWKYENLDQDFTESGLSIATNNWDQVDDFNWLAMDTASPNWSILPEKERVQNW